MVFVSSPVEMKSTLLAAIAARVCSLIPPEASSLFFSCRHRDRSLGVLQAEVVDHGDVCTGCYRLVQFC